MKDYRRILERMDRVKISVDATSGVGPGFADPSGQEAFLSAIKSILPVTKRLGCKQIILLSGKKLDGAPCG